MIRITAWIVFLVVLLGAGTVLPVDDVAGETPKDFVSVILNAVVLEGASKDIADQVHRNDEFAEDLIKFLNRDFETHGFDKRTEIICADILYTVDGNKEHFGFAVVTFPDQEDAKRAFKAVKSVGRENFKVKVLTVFRVFQVNRHFVILYSESPLSQHTTNIFDNLSDYFTY